MQFFAVCRRRSEAFSDEAFAELLDAEAEAVRRLYAAGIIRHAWTRDDAAGAVLMIEAESTEAVHAAMADLPLVSHNMLEVQLIPVRGYRGFGPQTT